MTPIITAMCMQFSRVPRATLMCRLECHNDLAGRTRLLVPSQSMLTAVTKHHRLGGLQTTEIHFSQFWSLKVQYQGARMVRFWWQPYSELQMADFLLCPPMGWGK